MLEVPGFRKRERERERRCIFGSLDDSAIFDAVRVLQQVPSSSFSICLQCETHDVGFQDVVSSLPKFPQS